MSHRKDRDFPKHTHNEEEVDNGKSLLATHKKNESNVYVKPHFSQLLIHTLDFMLFLTRIISNVESCQTHDAWWKHGHTHLLVFCFFFWITLFIVVLFSKNQPRTRANKRPSWHEWWRLLVMVRRVRWRLEIYRNLSTFFFKPLSWTFDHVLSSSTSIEFGSTILLSIHI